MQQWFFLENEDNERKRTGADKIDYGPTEKEEEKVIEGPIRKWRFSVRCPDLLPGEVVCIIGNIPELGSWQPEKCIELEQGTDVHVWTKDIVIPNTKIEYRYCVCVIVESGIQVIVRNWEAFKKPRVIELSEKQIKKKHVPEEYGFIAIEKKIDRGWLCKETAIQLKLSDNPLNIWRQRYSNRKYFIKVTPVSLLKHNTSIPKNMSEALEESLSADTQEVMDLPKHSYVEVASLNSQDCTFQLQPQFGLEFKPGDMVIYQTSLLFPGNTAFLIDLYTYSTKAEADEPPYHAGFTYLLPSALQGSEGALCLPLTSTKQRPLGELKLEYLVVRPMTHFSCDMSSTYTRYWNKRFSGLDVGHRGSGSSFQTQLKNCAEVRENTIASMKTAIKHGADLVEFDVQLSKDMVPVIYHDFHVCVSMKRKKDIMDADMLEIPLKELSLEQLKLLKVYHLTEAKLKSQRFFDEDLEEHQPFPTLQQILEVLDPHVGFNIEIKWNMERIDGTYEVLNPLDVNMYLDVILETVLKYAGERRIIFSCFNPDICTIIRLKQNKYPVMFLTIGETNKWPPYKDLRTRSIPSAAQFAQMAEILGICAHTEDILRDASLVNVVKEAGLVMFCWGDDNADPATIKHLKELGLHGVIFDKIYQYQQLEKTESIFLVEARESQKELIRLAAVASETKVSPAPVKEKLLDLDKARQNLPTLSTATSLVSLESRMSDFEKDKEN